MVLAGFVFYQIFRRRIPQRSKEFGVLIALLFGEVLVAVINIAFRHFYQVWLLDGIVACACALWLLLEPGTMAIVATTVYQVILWVLTVTYADASDPTLVGTYLPLVVLGIYTAKAAIEYDKMRKTSHETTPAPPLA